MLLKTYLIKENTEVLKELFEKYNISLEQIILKEYKRLKLTQDEAWVLISLFNISKDDKIICEKYKCKIWGKLEWEFL